MMRACILVASMLLLSSALPATTLATMSWPQQQLGHGADGVPFVENNICQQCHPQAWQSWRGSHHERAMQLANAKTVLGNFRNAIFTHQGITSRFFTRDGQFFVHTEGPDGHMADFPILYTVGVEPLQQYLIPMPGGRLQSLTTAWDTQKQRWFHLYPNEKVRPGDPLHWTGLYQTWNVMCAECHSTNLRKQYDAKSTSYQTTWSAINVSCQACHGPGGRHVAWAKDQKTEADQLYSNKGLVVDFTARDGQGQVEQCARCHARRHPVSVDDQHGRPLLDDFVPEVLRDGLYHADGQILDEVYVYGSYLQSKMYHAGVRCTDCHQPHTATLRAQGNALCVQCHQTQPDTRFPTLPSKAYNTPQHHFHAAGSTGAQCVNCHMPAKTYMRIDDRRDHSFRVPRPDLSAQLGTPNVCTGCHQGRTPRWAADTLIEWYGAKNAPHFATILAAGRAGQAEALPQLVQLAETTTQPVIVRATAVELIRQYGTAGARAIVAALQDADALIRVAAVGGLDSFPPRARRQAAVPLLQDPIRAVRIEAARILAALPRDSFTPPQQQAFDAALAEFTALQLTMADTPGAHLNLGVLESQQGRLKSAEQSYHTALRFDASFLPARFNLANLYNRMGRNADAEGILREGLRRAPDEGELYYSLGLLLAEEQRLDEAAEALGKAAQFLPNRARVHYNYGLTLQHLERRPEAETALLKAHDIAPQDGRVLQALAILYIQAQRWDRAATYAEQLARLFPNAPGPQQMLLQIQQQRGH